MARIREFYSGADPALYSKEPCSKESILPILVRGAQGFWEYSERNTVDPMAKPIDSIVVPIIL